MAQLTRFGVSMDAELLAAFDALIAGKGYLNRSEALRDLVRDAIVQTQWESDAAPTAAALCIVYDHHAGELAKRLAAIQHDHAGEVTAALHVHLDPHNCLEIIVLKGPPGDLQRLANQILSLRGVKHGRLVMTTTGSGLK